MNNFNIELNANENEFSKQEEESGGLGQIFSIKSCAFDIK